MAEITILTHIAELVTPLGRAARRGKDMNEIRILHDAAVVIQDGIIQDVGDTAGVLSRAQTGRADIRDLSGHAVVPGFVDAHTHFLFGGFRPEEFMLRLQGASYLEIHKSGGGIENTVRSTRAETAKQMLRDGKDRLFDALSMGVTSMEGKSGYGLDKTTELTMLQVMRQLNQIQPVEVTPTYLGGHSIPAEYKGRADEYISFMITSMLPLIKEQKLAEFVDIFCEDGVFTVKQSEKLLSAASSLGFGTKIHADEIMSTGGAELAARVHCTSADHLLMISEQGIRDLASSATIATLLPCTAFCLAKPYAPARKLIDAGCAVSLASDYNPGSCYTNSIPLLFALAVIHMSMTLPETLTALTLNGAAAIGRADKIGSIEPGKQADLVVLRQPSYTFLVYNTAKNQVAEVIKKGKSVYQK